MTTPFEAMLAAVARGGQHKFCQGCRRPLPASEFTANAANADGLQSECRACRAEMRAEEWATSETHQRSAAKRAAAMEGGNAMEVDVRAIHDAAVGQPCPGECGGLMDESNEVDHVVALADGGRHDVENLRSLCHGCHVLKSRRERLARRPRQP